MDRSVARVGAWAGVISVIGIAGYHLGLMIVAGQRVSGTTDAVAITKYYRNEAIAAFGVELFLVVVPIFVFAVALRETMSTTSWARFLATIGLVALVTEMAVNLTGVAAQMSLVVIARSGGDVVPLFRFWDTLYNSGAYALEAGWVAAFGLAMRDVVGFPRWLTGFSLITAALLALNVFAIWVGVPDTATLPSALFLVIWFVSTSYGLSRGAMRAASMPSGLALEEGPLGN
jgi:hypothetical protein